MNDNRPNSQVTLEDLLRVKRAEKPDAAFWAQFEQEFRAKQLAAAVERKRWWYSLPSFLPRLVKYSLPVGATAVLALTFVTVRHNPFSGERPVAGLETVTPQPMLSEIANTVPSVPSEEIRIAPLDAAVLVASYEPVLTTVESVSDGAMAAPSSSEFSEGATRPGAVLSPSARLIAANMAEAEGEFARLLHRRVSEVRVVEEPLAQISFPSATRGSRVLPPQMAQLASYSMDNERSSQVTERQARRLSEDQFYDAARRLSAQADRLMLKL